MNRQTQQTVTADLTAIACATHKSCGPDTGCRCNSTPRSSSQRRRLKAAMPGVLCVLGCLAVPIAMGGFAALGGALAGEAWLIIAGVAVAAVVAVMMKRRGTGSIC